MGRQTRLERAKGIDNTKEQNQKVTFDAKNPKGSRAGLTDNPGKRKTVISGESVKRVKENPVFKYRPENPFKIIEEESVKKNKMNMGGQAMMGGRQNLANEETNRPNFGRDMKNYDYRNASKDMGRAAPMRPPGMREGGKAGKPRGHGIARGGKACQMM